MIARARKAFPGMLVSLLLTVPSLAQAEIAHRDVAQARVGASQVRGQVARNEVRNRQATRPAGMRKTQLAAQRRKPIKPVSAKPAFGTPAFDAPVWSDGSGQWRQVGRASWYGGPRWQGRLTSGGQRYDEGALTAAHATLPLGSRVRVTMPDSGRSVVVVINDRPGTRARVIDLSRAAASELGMVHRGVALVSLTRD